MPLYEYKCVSCGEVFEVMQKFSDEPLRQHEVCGGAVERLLSAPALQFKGSGWYVTDYARAGSAGKNGPDGKPEGAAAKSESGVKKDSGGSDATPSTKSSGTSTSTSSKTPN